MKTVEIMRLYSFLNDGTKGTGDSLNSDIQHGTLKTILYLFVAMIFFLFSACSSKTKDTGTAQQSDHTPGMAEDLQAVGKPYIVTVSTYDFAFSAPGKIPYGWITFKLSNKNAANTHELSITHIPEGVSYKEYLAEYVGAWAKVLKEFQEGKIEASDIHTRAEELLPEWADEVTYVTSRTLVSPGGSAEKTLYMEPGRYSLDCWAKTSDGYLHVSSGMTRPLTVTEEPANSPEPAPGETITLHKNEIEVNWSAGTGYHSFALYFDQDSDGTPVHSNIHLIKLDEDTNLDNVNTWLDWYRVGGLRTPAPVDFLGGISTYYSESDEGPAYFSITIDEPGEYAWIVQVLEGEQLWKKFTIE